MSQYRTGRVSVTNGSPTVTGDVTAFEANVSAGDLFTLISSQDNPVYEVASVTDDTHFVLTTNYSGTSMTSQEYVVARDFTPNLSLPMIHKGDKETASLIGVALAMLDDSVAFDTDITSATAGQVLEYDGTTWVNQLLDTLGTVTTGTWAGTTIAVAHGGTGKTTTPTNGQLLIGNGSGYTLATITAGTAVSVTNGSGTITIANTGVTSNVAGTGISVSGATGAVTIANTGVLSIAGTTHQVIASGSTGAITLSLPQSIDTTSSPTFASITISNAPSASTDATSKAYVDAVAQGLEVKQAVRVSPTSSTNINISNPGTSTFDSVVLTAGDRILLRGQTTASQNGIWVFNGSSSAMTRPSDFNGSVDGSAVTNWAGSCVFVSEGTTFGNCFYVLTTNNPITVDTTSQAWSQFGGPGTYIAGTGLSLSSSTFSISSSWAGQVAITTLGTITTGTWNGTAIDLTAYVTGILPSANGGTGVNNGASTITLAGNLVTSGANSLTLTTTGATNVTLPTSGTLVNSAVTTLSSLTSVGTIGTGVWNATKIGTNKGGTNLTSYVAGDLLYASAANVLSALNVGTNVDGSVLTLASGLPTWSIVAGLATFANPTNTIGLTVKNGTAVTAMRSDAAQALDQSIAPTWTNTHTFSSGTVAITSATNPQFTLQNTANSQKYAFSYNLSATKIGFFDSTASAWRLQIADTTGQITLPTNIASTSTSTGTLVLSGGLGVAGAGWFGSVNATGAVNSTGVNVTGSGASIVQTTTADVMSSGSVYHRFNDVNGNAGYIGFGGTSGVMTIQNYKAGTIVLNVNGGTAQTLNSDLSTKFGGITQRTVGTGLTAAGTTQGTALALTKEINEVTTCASGAGVVMPSYIGATFIISNQGANACLVYPVSSAAIDALGTNAAFSLDVGARVMFVQISATQYRTLNATYA